MESRFAGPGFWSRDFRSRSPATTGELQGFSTGNYRRGAQTTQAQWVGPRWRRRIIGAASPLHRPAPRARHSFIGEGVTVSSGQLGRFPSVLRREAEAGAVTVSSVTGAAGFVEARARLRFDVALQDQFDCLRMVVASLPSDASTALAAPDSLRAAILGLEVVVADAERVSALRADGLLRGSIDPNESVALQGVLPSVSLSSTAREGPAKRDEPSRARSADREPLTAGSPV